MIPLAQMIENNQTDALARVPKHRGDTITRHAEAYMPVRITLPPLHLRHLAHRAVLPVSCTGRHCNGQKGA